MSALPLERRPRAWVLNLDAEHELEARGAYAPTRHLAGVVARTGERLLGTLVQPGDVVLSAGGDGEELAERGLGDAYDGHAWCPTPRALARLRRAGVRLPEAPPIDVLRTVNARPFAAAVRAPLQGASFAKDVAIDLDAVLGLLARPAADGWLVRRTFGAAGRGRRRLAAGGPSDADCAWLVASLRRGPLVVEPWVRVTREYTKSGLVLASGAVHVAAPCLQVTTASGAWTCSARASASEASQDDLLLEEACAAAGRALARAGYTGPFGIDAFRHRSPCGEVLNPLSEINARFTMDCALTLPDAGRVLGV